LPLAFGDLLHLGHSVRSNGTIADASQNFIAGLGARWGAPGRRRHRTFGTEKASARPQRERIELHWHSYLLQLRRDGM
jgi:hypothetical protein